MGQLARISAAVYKQTLSKSAGRYRTTNGRHVDAVATALQSVPPRHEMSRSGGDQARLRPRGSTASWSEDAGGRTGDDGQDSTGRGHVARPVLRIWNGDDPTRSEVKPTLARHLPTRICHAGRGATGARSTNAVRAGPGGLHPVPRGGTRFHLVERSPWGPSSQSVVHSSPQRPRSGAAVRAPPRRADQATPGGVTRDTGRLRAGGKLSADQSHLWDPTPERSRLDRFARSGHRNDESARSRAGFSPRKVARSETNAAREHRPRPRVFYGEGAPAG